MTSSALYGVTVEFNLPTAKVMQLERLGTKTERKHLLPKHGTQEKASKNIFMEI